VKEANKAALVDAALNAACRAVQDALGVTDGAVAGIFFTSDEGDAFARMFHDYIDMELSYGGINKPPRIELFSNGFMDPDTGVLLPAYLIETPDGEWIHDPWVTQDGRAACTPADHGITDEAAAALVAKNEAAGYRWKLDY
jgi:hypothetical protein